MSGYGLEFIALTFSGCEYHENKESNPILTEATVINKIYNGDSVELAVSPTYTKVGIIGYGFNGQGINIDGMTYTEEEIPEEFITKFKFSKGELNIDDENIFNKFTIGQKIKLTYVEVYEDTIKKEDGHKKIIKTEFVENKFISAESK